MLKTPLNLLDDWEVIHMRKIEEICLENHPQAAHMKSTAFPQKNVNK